MTDEKAEVSECKHAWKNISSKRQTVYQCEICGIYTFEQPAQQQEPYGWAVTGLSSIFMGEFAEYEAKAEAKRVGGTSVAFPLYTSTPASKPLTDGEIDKQCPQFEDPMRREMWIIGFKAAHGIKEKNNG